MCDTTLEESVILRGGLPSLVSAKPRTSKPWFNGHLKQFQTFVQLSSSYVVSCVFRRPESSNELQGYSYGSLIASLHPALPLPMKTSHVFISYPLGTRGLLTLFHTNTYRARLQELIRNPTSNILIMYGDQDEFTGASSYENWRKELEHEGSERLKVVEIKGASHFWRGRQGRELVETVKQWLK